MTHRLTPDDYRRAAVAIMDGAAIEDAARLIGVTGRTLYRRMNADAYAERVIHEAVALREARREPAEHGTTTRYSAGCRCVPCRDAASNASRLRRHRRRGQPIPDSVKHGSPWTYRQWSCRCEPCTKAYTAYCRPYVRAYWARPRASLTASPDSALPSLSVEAQAPAQPARLAADRPAAPPTLGGTPAGLSGTKPPK